MIQELFLTSAVDKFLTKDNNFSVDTKKKVITPEAHEYSAKS